MSFNVGGEKKIDQSDARTVLLNHGVELTIVDAALRALPGAAVGAILYGSQARGDSSFNSDIDLLVIADHHAKTRAVGAVNVATYDLEQFRSARGTLFGMHIARDGIVLHDAGELASVVQSFGPVDEEALWARISELASLLDLPKREIEPRLAGFVRHARYVLRTATYALAIKQGEPCFSVAELAERFEDPNLVSLLSSHKTTQGPPSFDVLGELSDRIKRIVSPPMSLGYVALADVVVGEGAMRPQLADAALMILGPKDEGPYTEIPRVIL